VPRHGFAAPSIGDISEFYNMEKIEPGMLIEFEYPASNHRGVRPRWERRRVRVDRIRLLDDDPLDPITKEWNPLVVRGARLIIGFDLDKRQTRSFYEESMRDVAERPELTYAGDCVQPERFAVVCLATEEVVARGLHRSEAEAFAGQWSIRHGMTSTVIEPVNWPSDDQVLEQLQLVR